MYLSLTLDDKEISNLVPLAIVYILHLAIIARLAVAGINYA